MERESLFTDAPSATTRVLLARLDGIIIEMHAAVCEAAELSRRTRQNAEKVAEIETRMRSIRQELRPDLDPSAPREFPYDKR